MFSVFFGLFKVLFFMLSPLLFVAAGFLVLSCGWLLWFRYHDGLRLPASAGKVEKLHGLLHQLVFDVPRRFALDLYSRKADEFRPHGIHMFCGEQGSGKTIAAVQMMLRLKAAYPAALMMTNFCVTGEDKPMGRWQDLLTYNNAHRGVIVGIDEIQNWFMSGKNQLPPEMLEVVTQNRKNRRILCCTAQVFTRVSKAIREQVTLVYQPHTLFGCWTIVVKRKPIFDSEGNVKDLKYRGVYGFVHTKELRAAYDTYRVIHHLAAEGFKDSKPDLNINIKAQGTSR